MSSIQISKIVILLAILVHLLGIGELFGKEVMHSSQLLTLCLLILAFVSLGKKKGKRKRKKSSTVSTLLNRAKERSSDVDLS
ncbi:MULTISPECIES: hypothetical protein [Brevibacillus]|uniref:Uncharacterized protein n=1 Tax=Brevibacillus laterosporus TaxID=1465 RepID=A0AAP3DJ15_BRELA|nr:MULTISPECIES: hypothetical protein [Brevibacillus]ATO49714.1 hypothetical protein BrL25_11760 [Brevibacillus laterosporus DSM 25]AYB40155.1 hypothetical protein D5F52_18915 [Brevibacillus laterosporus]MBG9774036.1 hypothetical protein [Brevibacillus laterosporus]MBG9787410.1 hypothetical protein [Brevibacillus laterosporus]MBG9799768.1 hypothetical protein [Brevibacillus laterosporus]